MKHSLKISLHKNMDNPNVVKCRTVTLWDRALRRLLGEPNKIMVIVPGSSVKTLSIQEEPEGEDD